VQLKLTLGLLVLFFLNSKLLFKKVTFCLYFIGENQTLFEIISIEGYWVSSKITVAVVFNHFLMMLVIKQTFFRNYLYCSIRG